MPVHLLERIPPSPEVIKHGIGMARNLADPTPPILTGTVPGPEPGYRLGPDNDDVHEMKPKETIQVAQSLAEAFEDDPHFSFMLRNKDKRLQRLGHGILSFIQHDWQPNGLVHTNDQLSGAAIWTNPGEWQASIPAQARILKDLIGIVTPAEVARLSYVLGFVEGKHKEIEQKWGEHYYLAMVGITPEWQRKGWGDALLKPMLQRCDEEGMPAYLESSTEESVSLYERNDFEVIARGHYRGATEPLHFMWRRSKT